MFFIILKTYICYEQINAVLTNQTFMYLKNIFLRSFFIFKHLYETLKMRFKKIKNKEKGSFMKKSTKNNSDKDAFKKVFQNTLTGFLYA